MRLKMANLSLFFTLHVKKCTDTDAAGGLLIPLLTMNNIWAMGGCRGAEATFPRLFTNICKGGQGMKDGGAG